MIFEYEAMNEVGNTITGEIEANSKEDAMSKVAERGHIPQKVVKKSGHSGNKSGGFMDKLNDMLTPVTSKEIVLFTKQFQTMLRAGVSMIDLLNILENQTENEKLKKVVIAISTDIKEGCGLYDAFKKHPSVFDDLYCSMLKAGEISGALAEVLDRLSYIIEHEDQIQSDIKSALLYPKMVTGFLGVAFVVLLMFVIPQFASIFEQAKLELPLPTKVCIFMYGFISDYWMFIIGGVIGIIVLYKQYVKTNNGKYVRDSLTLRLPIFGPLLVKSAMSRFASIFAILQSSGVGILDAMKVLSDSIGNAAITREFDKLSEQLAEGRGIATPLKSAKFFTPMVINMVAIGEETGNLDEMLTEVSKHYDIEVAYSTKALSDAIAPLLTAGLAAVVGFFALAIFLPMWDLTKMVK